MYGRESPGLEFRIPGFKPGIALPLFGLNLFILIFDIRENGAIPSGADVIVNVINAKSP